MKTDYDLRQADYELARLLPTILPGFTLYRGRPDSKHIILGEDHSLGAILAINVALDRLVDEKTLVIGETPRGTRDYFIRNSKDAFEFKKELCGWNEKGVELLLKKGAHLIMHDSSSLMRLSAHLNYRDTEEFMRQNKKRELKQAQLYLEKTKEYDRVIGVYGTLHVLSPVLHQILEHVDIGWHTYVGFNGKPHTDKSQ